MEYVAIVAVMALAGAIHGAAGFGLGLVTLGLLGGVINIKEASIAVTMGGIVVTTTIVLQLGRYIERKDVLPVMVAAVIGAPLGVLCLARMDEQMMHALVGGILLVAAVQAIVPGWGAVRWHRLWMGIPMGLLCGVMGGAFGTGGPPAVAHFASGRRDRRQFSASVQLVLLAVGLVRLGELLRRGMLTPELAVLGTVGAAAAAGGTMLGLVVLRRLSDTLLRGIVVTILFVLGAGYVVTAAGVL